MKTNLLITLIAASALSSVVHAQTLVEYTFTGGSSAPATTAANATAGNAAWTGASGAGFSSSSGTAYVPTNGTGSSFQSGSYLSFTIIAQTGYFLNLNELNFDLGGQNSNSLNPLVVNSSVRSSIDGFTSNLTINPGSLSSASATITTTGVTQLTSFSADLSGAAFNNVSTVTFRIYPWDNQSLENSFLRYDNIGLEGVVTAVPEPSTTALLAGSLIGLLTLGRRFRKRA